MDGQWLIPAPGFLNHRGVGHIDDLTGHVQFTHAVQLGLFIGQLDQVFAVTQIQLTHLPQPVVDQTMGHIFHGGFDPAATIVPHHHDVLHLQHIHGELQHRQQVQVGVIHQIGHVAVHKQLAGHQPHHLVGRYARVRTANPQILRTLLFAQRLEEARVLLLDVVAPLLVVAEEFGKGFHGLSLHSWTGRQAGHPGVNHRSYS